MTASQFEQLQDAKQANPYELQNPARDAEFLRKVLLATYRIEPESREVGPVEDTFVPIS